MKTNHLRNTTGLIFAAFRLMRFQEARWQRAIRSALIPMITGLIIWSGLVMAQVAGNHLGSHNGERRRHYSHAGDALQSALLVAACVLGGLGFLV